MPSKTEANIQKEIMLALSQAGCTIFRNNTGAYKTEQGGFIRYGVGGKGGSDLLGISYSGRFLAVEVKTAKGKPTNDQVNFINVVKSKNGIAFIARSAEEAVRLLNEQEQKL